MKRIVKKALIYKDYIDYNLGTNIDWIEDVDNKIVEFSGISGIVLIDGYLIDISWTVPLKEKQEKTKEEKIDELLDEIKDIIIDTRKLMKGE